MNAALGIIILLLILQILQNDSRLKQVTQELRKLRQELESKQPFK
jgi:cell division protein FtsL